MPKKKEVDAKSLIQMIESGTPQKEIMESLGFKNSSQLKIAYANALMDAGKVAEIQSGRGAAAAKEVSRVITVNKRGSLVLPRALVESLGIDQGAEFEVRPSRAGLSLRKV